MEASEYRGHTIQVRKEGLPIRKNESLGEYTRALNDSVMSTFTTKLSIQKDKAGIYVCEVFQSSVIFEVYKYQTDNPKDRLKYYAATYKRKDDGAFEFGESQEVSRVTRYEAVSAVTKSMVAEILPADAIWEAPESSEDSDS